MDSFEKALRKRHKNITTKDLWYEDSVQFPRLIAELEYAGVFTDVKILNKLQESMDLEQKDILSLVNRACNEFDKVKSKL